MGANRHNDGSHGASGRALDEDASLAPDEPSAPPARPTARPHYPLPEAQPSTGPPLAPVVRGPFRPPVPPADRPAPADHRPQAQPTDEDLFDISERLLGQLDLPPGSGPIKVLTIERLAGGNTAAFVGKLGAGIDYVLKVDDRPELRTEAQLLRQIKQNLELPELLRDAFPELVAIGADEGFIGYLMEDLSDCAAIASTLDDEALSADLLTQVVRDLFLPAYESTLTRRTRPNTRVDYVERVRDRLMAAEAAGLAPPGDLPMVVNDQLLPGWSTVLDDVERRLEGLGPTFTTWLHGDPIAENILWRPSENAGRIFRIIDPKPWTTGGDWVFDLAKMCQYIRVVAPAQQMRRSPEVTVTDSDVRIAYHDDSVSLRPGTPEQTLLNEAQAFADSHNDSFWRERLELGVGTMLLAIVGPRGTHACRDNSQSQLDVAMLALATGTQILHRQLERST